MESEQDFTSTLAAGLADWPFPRSGSLNLEARRGTYCGAVVDQKRAASGFQSRLDDESWLILGGIFDIGSAVEEGVMNLPSTHFEFDFLG